MVTEIVNLASQFPYPQGQPTLGTIGATTGATYAHVAGSVDPTLNELISQSDYNTRLVEQLTEDDVPYGVSLMDLVQADWSLQQQITQLREGQEGLPTDTNISNQLQYKADKSMVDWLDQAVVGQGAEIDSLSQQIANLNAAIGSLEQGEGFQLGGDVLGDAVQATAYAGNPELSAGVAKAFYDSDWGNKVWSQGNWSSNILGGMRSPFGDLKTAMDFATEGMRTGSTHLTNLSNGFTTKANALKTALDNMSPPTPAPAPSWYNILGYAVAPAKVVKEIAAQIAKLITWASSVESAFSEVFGALTIGSTELSGVADGLTTAQKSFGSASLDFSQLKGSI